MITGTDQIMRAPRPSSIPRICIGVYYTDDSGRQHYGFNPDKPYYCASDEHEHEPNPEWWITEDGFKFQVGDRLFNYYDCKWGYVVSEPDDHTGWFNFSNDPNDRYGTSLNSVRVSKNPPDWYKGDR